MPTYIPLQPFPAQFQDPVTSTNLSGGSISFYIAGTSTPTELYSDPSGTSVGVSIDLDSGGFPALSGNIITLFRDQDVSLKLIARRASGSVVFTADNITSFIDQLDASVVGKAFYPTSTAEQDAGVTPVIYRFEYGNVLRYGALGDGVTDDYAAIAAAVSVGGKITFPDGNYRTSAGLVISQNDIEVIFEGGAAIKPDASVLNGVTIGGIDNPARMNINSLRVDRTTYSGATENVGILWLETTQCTFTDVESRWSKYNHKWLPTTTGADYGLYLNLQGIGGFYNFWLDADAAGYVNENDFVGGRGFCTANTDTNLRIEAGGLGTGHNRFSMSLEGQGVQAIYDNGNANQFHQCRTEGTWSSGAGHVYGPNCIYANVISSRNDYTINRSAATDPRDQVITYRGGSFLNTANNGLTTLTLGHLGALGGSTLDLVSSRQNVDSSVIRGIRKIDAGSGTHDGADDAAILTDSTASFSTNALVYGVVFNLTDGSNGVITANDATTVTATLSGGANNNWSDGDDYICYLSNFLVDTTGVAFFRQKIQVGSSNPTYTETNVTTDRALNANSTTTAEIADVLGTLISDLRAKGLVN